MEASAGRRKVVGKYNLMAEIGHGGMADVFLAVSHGAAGVAKLAVLKEPRPEMAADPDLMGMFLDEAGLAARLNHPNIVQTYEVGQDGARYFIAMEYLEGQPLNRIRSKLKNTGGFPLAMQVRVLAEALAGLHYAHELKDYDGRPLNVVHRDVTPQNIFVTYNGHTKLVDFGIAKAESSAVSTRTGVLKGKMSYMSPEQARGDKVDRRTDIFAAGVLLWEAVAGKRMFKGLSDVVLLGKITHGELVPIREVVPGVPAELERIIGRALAFKPDDRYPTAAEMQAELEHYLGESTERTSPAALASLMTESFREEREKIQAVIELQLRQVEPRATAESLPRIDPARILGTTSLTDADNQSAPSLRTGGSLTSATAVSTGMPSRPQAPKRSVVFAVAAAVGAVAAAAAFLAFSSKDSASGQPASGGAAAPASSSAGPAGGEASGTVDLVVDVTPPDARVFLDDALLSTGKYAGKLPRDAKVYKLRVEAPGHTSRVELVAPTADVRLSVALEKGADPAASAAPTSEPDGPRKQGIYNKPLPTAPPPATAAAAKPPDEGGGLKKQNVPKPARTLDTDNPYAK